MVGAAAGAVSYTVNYFASGSYKTKYFSKSNLANSDNFTYDPNISKDAMQSDINTMRSDNFTKAEIQEFGVGSDQLAETRITDFGSYINPGNGQQYAYTTPKNFLTGTSDIVYAPITAQNKPLLALTMVHETGHAYGNKLGLSDIQLNYTVKVSPNLDTSNHLAFAKLERLYGAKNLITNHRMDVGGIYNTQYQITKAYNNINIIQKGLVDYTYNKMLPVFNRFMFYVK